MLADSVKVKGFSCFKENWVGFDGFKPITVIIGRNNSGKSHLIDLVERLVVSKKIIDLGSGISCSGKLDEEFLKTIFIETRSGVPYAPSTVNFNERYSYWNYTGAKFLDSEFFYESPHEEGASTFKIKDSDQISLSYEYKEAAILAIKKSVLKTFCALTNGVFRRIDADRDILNESSHAELHLAWNGIGATNIIRKLLLVAMLISLKALLKMNCYMV